LKRRVGVAKIKIDWSRPKTARCRTSLDNNDIGLPVIFIRFHGLLQAMSFVHSYSSTYLFSVRLIILLSV